MRERTTWDTQMIAKAVAKQAASARTAEDPRAMNQDHLKQQPSADKYVIGDPSDFAEDVHPSSGTWKAEMSGGEVKRNEIGMPEMRGDTFNHSEKTAALDEETVTKKAAVCVRVAKAMLPKSASADMVEDQAYSLMYMPDDQLLATHARLASVIASQDEEDEDEDGEKEEQQKQAGQLPPEFVKNMEEKKEQAKSQDDDKKEQSKEASSLIKLAQEQMMQMAQQMQQMQAQLQQMLQQAQQQGQMPMAQQQEQMPMAQQDQMPMAQQEQMPMANDDQMIDQILQQQGQGQGQDMFAANSEIELEPSMDIGDTSLTASEDESLRALFAQDTEYQNALHAASIQGLSVPQPQVPAPNTRTASTRTLGTRPTGGVSQLGGAAGTAGGGDVSTLSNLWQSAPDVKDVFR